MAAVREKVDDAVNVHHTDQYALEMLRQTKTIFTHLQQGIAPADGESFRDAIKFPEKTQQQDPYFLQGAWFDALEPVVPSIRSSLASKVIATRYCDEKKHESSTSQQLYDLQLAVKNTLEQSLLEYFAPQTVELRCGEETCNSSRQEVVEQFDKLPESLVLCLQRQPDHLTKNEGLCAIPAILDVGEFCSKFSREAFESLNDHITCCSFLELIPKTKWLF